MPVSPSRSQPVLMDTDITVTTPMMAEAIAVPDGFAHGFPPPWENGLWSLGPQIDGRQSSYVCQANRISLLQLLDQDPRFEGGRDYVVQRCRHWGWGWVEHLTFRALDADGAPTELFRALLCFATVVREFVVYDDAVLSQIEHNAALGAIAYQTSDRGLSLSESQQEHLCALLRCRGGINLGEDAVTIDQDLLQVALEELGWPQPAVPG